jgi:hypothetical protein
MTMVTEARPTGRHDKLIGALLILAVLVVIAALVDVGSILDGDPWWR